MTREQLLTVRWNNMLTLGLGLPAVIYVAVALSTSVLSAQAGFVGFAIFGALYWIVVEQHAAMRFAWLQKNADNDISIDPSIINRLILTVYNLVWWIPIVLTVIGTIDPRTGMIAFAVITVIRAVANGYRNNVLTLEQAINFPLRTP